jgi:Co/Zn/Cd efflux system component
MDCSAEEHLIRMKLENLGGIRSLRFDLPARKLEVLHLGTAEEVMSHLEQLRMGAVQVGHEENVPENGTAPDGNGTTVSQASAASEKGPLLAAFSINASLFAAELIADSLDMLADAIVYAMALTAVGGTLVRKRSIARLTGLFQGFLAIAGLFEVLRRSISGEGIPDHRTMIILSCIALIGNGATLLILNRTRDMGAHMKAAWICTSVDVQVNALVIGSGFLVWQTASRIPDLAAGGIIFILVANAARKILALSH